MSRFTMRAIAALTLSLCAASAFAQAADRHLRLGAAHFRAGRFDEAVVEFKVARELGSGDAGLWYVAAALTRAGRHLEAVEAFSEAVERAPGSADALFLYYRGVACSEARLIVCAVASFDAAALSAGPKVAAQAKRLAAEGRAVLGVEPPRTAIDELLRLAHDATRKGRPRLRTAFAEEALALTSRRADRWRAVEAERDLGRPDGGGP